MSGDVEMLQLQLLPSSLLVVADSLSEGPMLIMKGREKADTKVREDRGYIRQLAARVTDCLQAPVLFPVRELRSSDKGRSGFWCAGVARLPCYAARSASRAHYLGRRYRPTTLSAAVRPAAALEPPRQHLCRTPTACARAAATLQPWGLQYISRFLTPRSRASVVCRRASRNPETLESAGPSEDSTTMMDGASMLARTCAACARTGLWHCHSKYRYLYQAFRRPGDTRDGVPKRPQMSSFPNLRHLELQDGLNSWAFVGYVMRVQAYTRRSAPDHSDHELAKLRHLQ